MSKIISEISVIKIWEYTAAKSILTRTLASSSVQNSTKCPSGDRIKVTTGNSKDSHYDVVIVGGGIVGVATAREITQRNRQIKVAVLEKEKQLAGHQTGHNSGVVHAGIYYKPGSLKAKLCVKGLELAYNYFDSKGIPYKKCGKLIVATTQEQIPALKDLFDRGTKNKVRGMKYLTEEKEIHKIEPLCRGLEAIWSSETGIVDWGLVTQHYAKDLKENDGDIHLGFQVNGFCESGDSRYPIKITSLEDKVVKTKYVLTCAGLQSDRLAVMSGCSEHPKIVPFRGEYLVLTKEKACQFKTNIYPVPNPSFPFLGVHVTPRIDGSVWLGPNAVLAFKREGYTWKDVLFKDLIDTVFYPGFIRLGLRYIVPGAKEMIRSLLINKQIAEIQKLIPSITLKDIQPIRPAGVRAQALDIKGNLIDDFVFDRNAEGGPIASRILHCRNAPSPGATSSLAIAEMVADRCEKEFNLKEIK